MADWASAEYHVPLSVAGFVERLMDDLMTEWPEHRRFHRDDGYVADADVAGFFCDNVNGGRHEIFEDRLIACGIPFNFEHSSGDDFESGWGYVRYQTQPDGTLCNIQNQWQQSDNLVSWGVLLQVLEKEPDYIAEYIRAGAAECAPPDDLAEFQPNWPRHLAWAINNGCSEAVELLLVDGVPLSGFADLDLEISTDSLRADVAARVRDQLATELLLQGPAVVSQHRRRSGFL